MTAILSVFHHHETGWHSFTSPQLPGLFLAGPDADAEGLRDALPGAIGALIQAGGRRAVSVRRAETFRGPAAGAAQAPMAGVLHFLVSAPDLDMSKTQTDRGARDGGAGKAPGGDGQG